MYTIFTDTDTDLTPSEAEYFGYRMISMPYIIDGQEIKPYEDFLEFDYKSFYDLLRGGVLPKTCAINSEEYRRYFEPYLKAGKDILVIDNEREEFERFIRPMVILRDTIRGVIIRSDVAFVDMKLEIFLNLIKMPYTVVRDKKENMKKIKQIKIGKKNYYDNALITVDTNAGKIYKGRVTKCLATEELKTIWKYNKELSIIEFPKEIRDSFEMNMVNVNGQELMIIKETSSIDRLINFFKKKKQNNDIWL